MRDDHPQRVEDYTGVALAMGFVNLLWIMTALWAWLGLLPVLLLGLVLNRLITVIGVRVEASRQRYAPQYRPFDPGPKRGQQ